MDDTFFDITRSAELSVDDIAKVAVGRTAVLEIADFLPKSELEHLDSLLRDAPMELYDPRRLDPPILRFGPSLGDYRLDGTVDPAYWDHLDQTRLDYERAGLDPDPATVCAARMSRALGTDVGPAHVGGKPVGSGVVREFAEGSLIHYDDVTRELHARPFDEPLVAIFTVNIFIMAPAHGGETTVWRHRWQPEDKQFDYRYGYEPGAVAGKQSVTTTPAAGKLTVFDPRNYHQVEPPHDGRRVSVGFHMGMSTSGHFVTWC